MSTSQPQIFIGCGGTGIGTLTRLNRLLSQDEAWRRRLARDIYYVAIDTNEGELSEFEENVKLDCGKALPPKVTTISLGQGYQSIWPIMNRKFVRPFEDGGAGNADGKARLEEHYWHDKGHPFSADKVRVLRAGAGQCPPVSYFLSWHNMHGPIEDAFNDLIDSIIKRRSAGGQDPLQNINFHVVAGLAGGTGRGSWELVSLYLRNLFARYGAQQVTPFAYLLDSSCFRQVYRSKPAQEVQMKTNALTGLSQLSTWITDRKRDAFYEFRLPSMDAPHDPDQDVIRVDKDLDKVGDRPVQKAFVICGGNSHATLDKPDDFKDMLGTALYTTLYTVGRGDSIAAKQSNEPQPLYSLGAATLEVEAVRIRRFAEEQLRMERAKRLATSPTPQDQGPEADEFVKDAMAKMGFAKSKGKPELAETAYSILESLSPTSDDYRFSPKARKRRLLEALSDIEGPDDAVQEASKAIDLPSEAANRLLDGAFQKVDRKPLDALMECYESWIETSGSLPVVAQRLRAVAAALSKESRRGSAAQNAEDFKATIREMSGRQWFLVGKRFDAGELEDLEQTFPVHHRACGLAAIREALQSHREEIARVARRWATRADSLAGSAKRLVNMFDSSARRAAGVAEDKNPMKEVFFDPSAPEKALPGKDDSRRFYKRVLRPEEPESLDQLADSPDRLEPEIVELLTRAIENLDIDDRGAIREFEQNLEAQLRKKVNARPAAIERHFGLRGVAKDHARAWQARFDGLVNDPDDFENLAHQFAQFYGFRPELPVGSDQFTLFPGDMNTPDSGDELLLRMGVDLAAHCHPYWTISKASHEEINLFLPAGSQSGSSESDEKFKAAARNQFQRISHRDRIDQFHVDLSLNKYVAVAYAASGTSSFDPVQSFSYWREDSRVTKNLQRAESAGAALIFDDNEVMGGLGFTSPIYVNNEQIAENRWRPWFKEDQSGANSERERGLQALAYALLEVTDSRIQAGWSLPLLATDEKGALNFQREELFFDEHSSTPSKAVKPCLDDPQWSPGDALALGVHRALAVLSGERVDGSVDPEKALRIRGRILEEELEYWSDYAKRKQFGRMSRPHADLLEHMAQLSHERSKDAASRGQQDDADTWSELRVHYNALAQEARADLSSQE